MKKESTDSVSGALKEIASRVKYGVYKEYAMTETLCCNDSGQFFLTREFSGEYDEVNAARCDWILNHREEKISAEEAEKWQERNSSPNVFDSGRGLFPEVPCGIYFGYSSEEPLESYDGSWFRAMLEEHINDAGHILIEAGYCIYNETGNFWESMSDVMCIGVIEVTAGITISALCDAVTTELQAYRKRLRFNETVVFIERIAVYSPDNSELCTAENNPLPEVYAKMADTVNDFDMLSWN